MRKWIIKDPYTAVRAKRNQTNDKRAASRDGFGTIVMLCRNCTTWHLTGTSLPKLHPMPPAHNMQGKERRRKRRKPSDETTPPTNNLSHSVPEVDDQSPSTFLKQADSNPGDNKRVQAQSKSLTHGTQPCGTRNSQRLHNITSRAIPGKRLHTRRMTPEWRSSYFGRTICWDGNVAVTGNMR